MRNVISGSIQNFIRLGGLRNMPIIYVENNEKHTKTTPNGIRWGNADAALLDLAEESDSAEAMINRLIATPEEAVALFKKKRVRVSNAQNDLLIGERWGILRMS